MIPTFVYENRDKFEKSKGLTTSTSTTTTTTTTTTHLI